MQGRVLFNGKASPNGAWTEEEDQLAQMIELLGPFPLDLLSQGTYTTQYFADEGNHKDLSFNIDYDNNLL